PYAPTAMMTMPPQPRPPKPPKERSALGRVVLSAILVVMGVLLAVDRLLDVSIPGRVYVAVALGMVGAGLVVGAWLGRSRGLIPIGIALCLALAATTASAEWDSQGGVGSQRWTPATAADIRPSYDMSVGDGTLDLTGVDFTDATVTTRANLGFGHLVIRVPQNVDVTVKAQAGAGNLNILGSQTNGNGSQRTVSDLGPDGAGGGTLNIDAEVGFGELEVVRG
ncbi:MAG: LiaF domain-containing protein, partial [Mycobacteriales bacterium]